MYTFKCQCLLIALIAYSPTPLPTCTHVRVCVSVCVCMCPFYDGGESGQPLFDQATMPGDPPALQTDTTSNRSPSVTYGLCL